MFGCLGVLRPQKGRAPKVDPHPHHPDRRSRAGGRTEGVEGSHEQRLPPLLLPGADGEAGEAAESEPPGWADLRTADATAAALARTVHRLQGESGGEGGRVDWGGQKDGRTWLRTRREDVECVAVVVWMPPWTP